APTRELGFLWRGAAPLAPPPKPFIGLGGKENARGARRPPRPPPPPPPPPRRARRGGACRPPPPPPPPTARPPPPPSSPRGPPPLDPPGAGPGRKRLAVPPWIPAVSLARRVLRPHGPPGLRRPAQPRASAGGRLPGRRGGRLLQRGPGPLLSRARPSHRGA